MISTPKELHEPQACEGMRTFFVASILLALASPCLAEAPRPRYTTLVIQYTGDVIGGPALPVVITTSEEEGEWYRQHVLPQLSGSFAKVQVVPQSVLNEIAELAFLKAALVRAKPVSDEPKTAQNARFTAGTGHNYAQVTLDKQPSTRILKGIERIAINYPSLTAALHKLEYQLK